jgi:hypothetical protein
MEKTTPLRKRENCDQGREQSPSAIVVYESLFDLG